VFNSSDELLEVLDENGVSTGRGLSRKEIHNHGLWHRGAIVAILNDRNEILMQRRSKTKDKFPGAWDISLAGHTPFGEDSISTVVSETMEEIGYVFPKKLTIQDFRFLTCFRRHDKIAEDYIENQFYDLFVLNKNIVTSNLILQESEVEEVRFFSIPELLLMRNRKELHPRTEWIDVLVKYIKNI